MIKVKICGIKDPDAFDTAVEAGADWLGFNFFPASPRYILPRDAAALSVRMPGGPPRVGLFVQPSDTTIAGVLDVVRLDILQIYGRPGDSAHLRGLFGLPVWQPVAVAAAGDLPADAREADALLIEAKPPPSATRPGGNATRFDWEILRGWTAPAPWLLAGGLTVDNVAGAIRLTRAEAVDVSSGVERVRGEKDPALIRAFMREARRAALG
jgi:phosphoribosylanthranilate isomerase